MTEQPTPADERGQEPATGAGPEPDEHWFVIDGRRWRRTDPALPEEVAAALRSHLGSGRSGVRSGKRADDEEAVAAARRRVGIAKHGLGERGPRWWDEPEAARIERARAAVAQLDDLYGRRSG